MTAAGTAFFATAFLADAFALTAFLAVVFFAAGFFVSVAFVATTFLVVAFGFRRGRAQFLGDNRFLRRCLIPYRRPCRGLLRDGTACKSRTFETLCDAAIASVRRYR
ncbi:hypothetical protein [Paraburkholderia sp. RL18-085-BIA-A]|uniref:hypothetical protein n=1 Tax=Paraburkholderia sp. RL18-085-BIA-A TaxID=3031633 RepID=UPI0038B71A34